MVSVIVLASFVGSWFGISFGFGFKKAVPYVDLFGMVMKPFVIKVP
jgi:hypothetical protein